MVTAIATVFAVLVALALVLMFVQLCRGCLCATVWWCCGGAGVCVEFLGGCIAAIFDGLNN